MNQVKKPLDRKESLDWKAQEERVRQRLAEGHHKMTRETWEKRETLDDSGSELWDLLQAAEIEVQMTRGMEEMIEGLIQDWAERRRG